MTPLIKNSESEIAVKILTVKDELDKKLFNVCKPLVFSLAIHHKIKFDLRQINFR